MAGISGAASYTMMLLLAAALLAVGDAIRPTLLFDIFEAGIIGRKLSVELSNCIPQFYWDGLFWLHGR